MEGFIVGKSAASSIATSVRSCLRSQGTIPNSTNSSTTMFLSLCRTGNSSQSFYPAALGAYANCLCRLKEDIADGWENAEQAFVNLLTGKNTGKAVIKVSE